MCRQFDSGPRHLQKPDRKRSGFFVPARVGAAIAANAGGWGMSSRAEKRFLRPKRGGIENRWRKKGRQRLGGEGDVGVPLHHATGMVPPSPMSVHVRMMPLTDGAKASSFGLNLIYNAKHTTRTESQHTVFHHRTSIDVFRLLRPCRRTNHFGMRMATVFFGFQVHLSAGFA